MFLGKKILAAAVAANDRGFRECLGQLLTAGAVFFYDFYLNACSLQNIRQIVGQFATAHDHRILHAARVDTDAAEEAVGILRLGDDEEDVPLLHYKAAVGNGHVSAAIRGTDEDVLVDLRTESRQGCAREHGILRNAQAEQFGPPAGKAVDLRGARES